MTSTVTRDDAARPTTEVNTVNPVSSAQRQRAYRLRRKRAVIEAIGEEACASRVTLVALLGSALGSLDDGPREEMRPALKNSARRVLRILVTRYGIDLTDDT